MTDADGPAAEQLLRLVRRDTARAVVLAAVGEIDSLSAPLLDEALQVALGDAAGRPLVLDLARVDLLDATGLGVLLDTVRDAEHDDVPVRIVADDTSPAIAPIQRTGLGHRLRRSPTLTEALGG